MNIQLKSPIKKRESWVVFTGIGVALLASAVSAFNHLTGSDIVLDPNMLTLALGALGIGSANHVARAYVRTKEQTDKVIDELDNNELHESQK